MAYTTRPFSLKALTRVFEIGDDQMIRSRPSILAFWSAEDHYEYLGDITVRSTGNSLRGDVVILKDGQEVFTWKNVFRPRAKKKMLERLAQEAKAKHAASVPPRHEEPSATRTIQEPEPAKRPLVPGPSAILDGKANKNSR
jgi:hypothetical protein